jgi:tetratricopeptide (TPR) repeat protein
MDATVLGKSNHIPVAEQTLDGVKQQIEQRSAQEPAINSRTAQIRRIAWMPTERLSVGRIRRWGVLGALSVAVVGAACQVPAQTAPGEAVRQEMQLGAAAMSAESFAQAVEAYARVTRLQPGFAEGFFNLGLAEERTGKLDEARADLGKALRLKPVLHGAHLFLGTIAYRQNHFKEAEEHFLRETQLDPQSARAFMWLGVCRLAEDKPEAAIAPLDRAHQLAPADVDTLYHRGRAYLLVAKASYATMFKLDPDSIRVHEVLAESEAEAYRTEEAIAQYELAVKTAPKQSGLHESLGDQYWIFGNLDKAGAAYRTELDIDPEDTVARFKLGCLLVVHGSAAEGVSLLQQVLREDSSLSDAHYYLGHGLLELDRNEEAVREYELAIAADPSNDRALSSYYRLSQAYRKLQRMDEARAALANYQRLKAQAQAQVNTRSAQMIRKRSQLPVDDPEQVPESANH